MTPKEKAIKWLDNGCLVLDTETTGLGKTAEVVEISIIDQDGQVLMDTLVKPKKPIPADATRIHGITNEMVANAPTWPEIHDQLCEILTTKLLVIYNSGYDISIMRQTAELYDLDILHPRPNENCFGRWAWQEHGHDCAMLTYAEYWGEWNDYRNDWKWQKLSDAADQQGVIVEGKAHRALADCKMTLGVIKAMASKEVCPY